MSEVQELRDQLDELGFTVLNDSNVENAHANVLNVEVWVRYNPYSLIPIPIRGLDEDDQSYGTRINIANDSIAVLFAQEQHDALQLEGGIAPDSYEILDDEAEYEHVADTDYYAYTPPVVAVPDINPEPIAEETPNPEPMSELEKSDISDSAEYASPERDVLLAIRKSLQSSLDSIDRLLAN